MVSTHKAKVQKLGTCRNSLFSGYAKIRNCV